MTVSRALPGSDIVQSDDETELRRMLEQGDALLLINRQLDWGFETDDGVELAQQLQKDFPSTRSMLVSNFPEAQVRAQQAGLLPGFGKRELGSTRVMELLKSAVNHAKA